MTFPPIDTIAGRRAWSFLAIVGGCIIMTVLAGFAVWSLRTSPGFTFWLAIAAHVQILIGMSALGWTLGRRAKFLVTRDQVEINDMEME